MKIFYFLTLFLGFSLEIIAQNVKPVSERDLYDKKTKIHSSLKPLLQIDTASKLSGDSVFRDSILPVKQSWLQRKLFTEHLIEVKKEDYTAYADLLPDFLIGKTSNENTWLNTRGFQIGGTIGKNFSFYTSGYENQGRFAPYYRDYVNETGVVPGQSYDRSGSKNPVVKDWSYATALISYTPIKYLNISIGQDKTFIGDGYRSLILSDVSSNYPFLKLTGNLGNVQYMAMWTAFQDPSAKRFSEEVGYRKKGGVFHYLDWNINSRLSLGFFDAIVWAQYDDEGNKRGFDLSYANPIIFLRPLEAFSGSPDNAVMGFTGKYEIFNKNALYGQFLLDEFIAGRFFSKEGDYRNKWGAQIGLRGADLFAAKGLSYLIEHNRATPYTYTGRNDILSYTQYNEPLAHPYGANFKETVGIISYEINRLTLSSKVNIARYGLDPTADTHYGKNIRETYREATLKEGTYIGQGVKTTLLFSESRLSFLLNPKTNLRFELGAVFRTEKNNLMNDNTTWMTFGLRSSFRNLYQDF
ncbi:MAG TPA: gliding motility protein RemB [Pedobacter sp.]|jgi:hypothetical protein